MARCPSGGPRIGWGAHTHTATHSMFPFRVPLGPASTSAAWVSFPAVLWDGVEAAGMIGVTPQQSPGGQPQGPGQPVALQGLQSVCRTAREKPTGRGEGRRHPSPVASDDNRDGATNLTHHPFRAPRAATSQLIGVSGVLPEKPGPGDAGGGSRRCGREPRGPLALGGGRSPPRPPGRCAGFGCGSRRGPPRGQRQVSVARSLCVPALHTWSMGRRSP